jgi:type I restriction enzyme M protein
MEACIVVCRANKPQEKRGKILIINAVTEVTRKNAQSWLEDFHIQKITGAYAGYADIAGFARVVTGTEIEKNNYSLSIPLYVRASSGAEQHDDATLAERIDAWRQSSLAMESSFNELKKLLHETVGGGHA